MSKPPAAGAIRRSSEAGPTAELRQSLHGLEQALRRVIRGKGEPVTDEYYLAVPRSGEHTLTVRAKSKPSQRLMTLKSVNLLFE